MFSKDTHTNTYTQTWNLGSKKEKKKQWLSINQPLHYSKDSD